MLNWLSRDYQSGLSISRKHAGVVSGDVDGAGNPIAKDMFLSECRHVIPSATKLSQLGVLLSCGECVMGTPSLIYVLSLVSHQWDIYATMK